MALERLSCHKDFKITPAQTKVGFFYLNPLLQVEFRAIFEPFSYILLNGSKRNAILSRMKITNNVWAACGLARDSYRIVMFLSLFLYQFHRSFTHLVC